MSGVSPPAEAARGRVAPFEPSQSKDAEAKHSLVIEHAKRMLDWPLLEEAVEAKMDEQAEFVRWWRENVSKGHGGNRQGRRSATLLSANDAEALTGITKQQVSKWGRSLQDKEKYRASLYGVTYRKAMAERGQADLRGASGTGENEWYTPPEFLDAARDVLGHIDLDPASSALAQESIGAAKHFTIDDDGLVQAWCGNVWLNPPYAQPAIANFVSKMVAEVGAGNVAAAIMLTHNYTDTSWFQSAAKVADAICFTRGRVRFVSPDGDLASPTQGQAFFYFGKDADAFAARFRDIGFVTVPVIPETADGV